VRHAIGLNGPRQALVVFAEDWGRHTSGCQHLIRHLLERYEVYWVNTIGTRRPALNRATLTRGLEKLRHWLFAPPKPAALPEHLHVLNPWMGPWFASPLQRRINRALLLRQLTPLVRSLPEPPTVITKIALVADLMGVLPVRRWVYYCVDDFSKWPGLDNSVLGGMEEAVVRRADRLIAVSEVLRERLERMGRSSLLLTHGVDLEMWQVPPDLAPMEGRERRPASPLPDIL